MDPATFRLDPYLRSSAYHLATWSVMGFVLELRGNMPAASTDSMSQFPVVVVLLAGAAMTSLTHERRLGKMTGPAGAAVFDGAGRMWSGVLAVLVAVSVLLLAASRPQLLFDVWIVGVGAGLVAWGAKAKFAWYLGLGAAMVVVGAVDVALRSAGFAVLALRCAVLAVVLPAAALVTNYRYLWFRPPSDR